jgi:hypothetical protein
MIAPWDYECLVEVGTEVRGLTSLCCRTAKGEPYVDA